MESNQLCPSEDHLLPVARRQIMGWDIWILLLPVQTTLLNIGRGNRIRTRTEGFGDLSSAIKLYPYGTIHGNRTRIIAVEAQYSTVKLVSHLVRIAGFEPARDHSQLVLSQLCLPFHHIRKLVT